MLGLQQGEGAHNESCIVSFVFCNLFFLLSEQEGNNSLTTVPQERTCICYSSGSHTQNGVCPRAECCAMHNLANSPWTI